ncbi:IclR family transcriptional regulator domain-containing protein [Sphingobium lignivorans]|uniref:IclR family pca regulon transcriptional regulator n=1 Tax=Sphingobium lignivorans TaxID=2735886 RepID=A0ABR6NIL4_9SPHN|nr:IclR family transcriptional regulator C-terminal domain-containing protein [Sphingobium lignivorans]MBB5987133.1 IclR family pca regulon transcriptional regulator [Sphingobium lignivorans]
MTKSTTNDDEYIPSLEKGLAVIALFSSDNPEWTLSQISRELKITPGSTRRILRTLELLGYAVNNDGRFRLTAKVLGLGTAYLSSQPFSQAAGPLLRELATKYHINCNLAILDNRDVVYVARATYKDFENYYIHVGARVPAYATSSGKVLLASLSPEELETLLDGWTLEAFTPNTIASHEKLREVLNEVRARDYATNDQDIFLGQRSISVPLRIDGKTTAAIVAATSVSRTTLQGLVTDLLPPLQAAARELEETAAVLL